MTILGLILTLIVVGVVLWLINTFLPMDARIKTLLNAVVIIALVVWIILALLPSGGFLNARIGHR